ncbi:glycosyltransferase, partial [Clostridium saudiense]|nr:glycosyltransferase [Clostridium saudiense]
MKILQINSVCGVGSTGRIVTDLYKVIEEQGHECVIAYGRGTAPEGFKTIKIGTNFDNYMHVAKTRLFDKHGFGSTKATKGFIKKIEEYNPDIIHLHNIHGYYLNIEILFNYLNKTKKKVVWTLHDCWAFTGHCCYFEYNACDKWKSGCGNCIQLKEYPKSIFIDNSRKNYSIKKRLFTDKENLTIVAVSEWLKNIVEKSFICKNEILKISNGIDLNIFRSDKKSGYYEKYGIKNKKVILGVANVWDARKGLNDFIKLSEVISEDYSIVLVGVSEEQIRNLPANIIGITRT